MLGDANVPPGAPETEAMDAGGNGEEQVPALRIDGLASGGEGVGRLEEGRVVFVEGGVPGDLVELADLRLQKKSARARIGRLLEASPDRVEARCEVFGRCGGCRWQHVRYETQLQAKIETVQNALRRIGGLDGLDDLEITPSPEAYGYRARARLVEIGNEPGRTGALGYRVRGSRETVGIERCPVLTPSAQDALTKTTAQLTNNPGRSDQDVSRSRRKRRTSAEWVISSGTKGVAISHKSPTRSTQSGESGSVTVRVLEETLRVSANSFMQGNALLWDALADEVVRQCTAIRAGASGDRASGDPEAAVESEWAPRRFVELYAGVGFLTCPLARHGLSGVAIESDRSALHDLRFNLGRGRLAKQVDVLAGRVESRGDLAARFAKADLLLVDPPRTGLESGVRAVIASEGPPRIVYVSCDPATLARDLRVLTEAGYGLSSIRAMDLFPQTPHVEVIARLDR